MTTNDKTTMTMSKHFLLSLTVSAILFLGPEAYAQNINHATPDSKMMAGSSTASGLNSISTPNLFDGSVNISVPIYSYNSGASDLGISLSYNTKGILVDEVAGQPGLHWNIQSVPTITRVVRDLPDEFGEDMMDSLLIFTNNSGHDTSIVNHEMHLKGKWLTYTETQQQQQSGNTYRDGECDEFVVSLGKSTFSFYIGKGFKVYTVPHRNIKVQITMNGVPVNALNTQMAGPLGFEITDEQGNKYVFESISDQKVSVAGFADWQMAGLEQFGYSPVTLYPPVIWKAKKIILNNGSEIKYNYISNYPHYKPSKSYYVQEDSTGSHFMGLNEEDVFVDNSYLSAIQYPNGDAVSFTYDPSRLNEMRLPMLQEIKVSNGDNCRRFKLYQAKTNGRWYLDTITQLSCDGSIEEPYYHFTYNPLINKGTPTLPAWVPSKLPERLNSGQDLYGYYNGDSTGVAIAGTTTDISVPQHSPAIGTNYGNGRSYNPDYAMAGLITSVKNAYGRTEHYYYSANVISSVPLAGMLPTNNNFVGKDQPDGVRVDSVVSTDTTHPGYRQVTAFEYAGGQLFMPGGYFHYPNYIDSITNVWKVQTFQNYYLTAHQLVNGSNHGYSYVSVYTYADQQLISHVDYIFTNMQDGASARYYKVSGSLDYFQYPYTDKQYLKDWEIGLPLTITRYDQNDRIVQGTVNIYDFSPVDLSAASYVNNTKTAKVNSGKKGVNIVSLGNAWFFYPYKKTFTDSYYPYSGTANLVQTINKKYITDTRFVTDTVWYAYDDHNNLSSTVTQNSKGDKTATELVYNYDVDGPQYTTGHPGYTAHPGTTLYNLSASGLEMPVSTEHWKLLPATTITDPSGGTVLQNNNLLLSSFITGYQYQGGKLWTQGLWNTQTGSPLGYTAYTGLASGVVGNPYAKVLSAYNTSGPVQDFMNTSRVTLFDGKGNPLETQLQGQDQYKAMIWDTASGQKLAEAANCRYSDIAYTSFENSLPEGNLTGNKSYIIVSSTAVTGSHAGLLWTQTTPGTAVSFTGTQNLQAGKAYILSFWVYGATPALSVGSQAIPLSSANLVYTKGSWKNYQVPFSPSAAGKIKITGTATFSQIDEIRLLPSGAQMQSWTYEPLFGKSSQTDPSGKIIYYRYDLMGRQNLVLDMDGNVLSKTDYHVAQ